jgi:hypothetical protein
MHVTYDNSIYCRREKFAQTPQAEGFLNIMNVTNSKCDNPTKLGVLAFSGVFRIKEFFQLVAKAAGLATLKKENTTIK